MLKKIICWWNMNKINRRKDDKQKEIQIFRAIFTRMNVSILKVSVCLKEVLGCWGLRSRHPTLSDFLKRTISSTAAIAASGARMCK